MDAGGPPGFAAVFDDRVLKAFAGLSGSARLEDRSVAASAGVKAYAAPWLDVEASVPWKWARGHDHEENSAIETSGVGDLSLSAAFDVLELANPSLVLKRCDDEGKKVWVPTDHFRFVKNPHLTLSASLSCPTGRSDFLDADRCDVLDARYQPGAGVWVPSLGLDAGIGLGRWFPGLGIRGAFPAGENPSGLRRRPSGSLQAGVTRRPKGKDEVWALDLSLSFDWVACRSRMDGAPLPGSRGNSVSLSLGGCAGLGRGFVLAARLTWVVADNQGHPENPWQPGFGGGVYLIAPCF